VGAVWSIPHRLRLAVWSRLLGRDRGLTAASEAIARLPGPVGVYARQSFYRAALPAVGEDVHFGFLSLFSKAEARLGDRVYIGRMCTLGLVTLEADVMLADGVQVLSGGRQHGRSASGDEGATLRDNEQTFERVTIGAGAWIGAGAVVMADVGAGAIVGAGAVVTRPVAPGARVGGVPAKPLGGAKPTAPPASASAASCDPSSAPVQ